MLPAFLAFEEGLAIAFTAENIHFAAYLATAILALLAARLRLANLRLAEDARRCRAGQKNAAETHEASETPEEAAEAPDEAHANEDASPVLTRNDPAGGSSVDMQAADATTILGDLAAVAASKKEASETVEHAKVASLAKVFLDKQAALEKVESERQIDGSLTGVAQAERERLYVARRAHIATLEEAWASQIATLEAAQQAKTAALKTARAAENAVLEAARQATKRTDSVTSVLEKLALDRKKAEAYTNHEIKNRLLAIAELCVTGNGPVDIVRIKTIVTEAIETIVKRGLLTQLASGSYVARPDCVDLVALLKARVHRIIFDNLLSNAIKYGDESVSPVFHVRVESLGPAAAPGDVQACSLRVELHNAAGPQHAILMDMGEAELNRVAAKEGGRVLPDAVEPDWASTGEGFPMSLDCARVFGGSLWLTLSESAVVAALILPRALFCVEPSEAQMEHISRLSYAVVDDSVTSRKSLGRLVSAAFPETRAAPVIAGESRESVEQFPHAVLAADADVVFVDQNFGSCCQHLQGTDLIASIRALDADIGRGRPRLVFVVSANDSTEDRVLYKLSGADDCLAKDRVSATAIRELLRRHAATGLDRVTDRL
ncbi:hypothetical protein M885DRAFT_566844 [Pelagophyceae sp. CCMP2097]|nr:hypothetical protein M885DRAFT_566844 [Pelagophyceae sp. CCMP2097]